LSPPPLASTLCRRGLRLAAGALNVEGVARRRCAGARAAAKLTRVAVELAVAVSILHSLVHTTVAVREQGQALQHYTRRWQCESRSGVAACLGQDGQEAGTYGGCVVGEDVQGLLRSLHRQVRRLLARRAASPNPDGRFDTRHSTPLHGVHSTTEGHLGVLPAVLRVRVWRALLTSIIHFEAQVPPWVRSQHSQCCASFYSAAGHFAAVNGPPCRI
jgi:hypothetical protein